jgi:phosphoglycerate dehydrogenase-like enzyme
MTMPKAVLIANLVPELARLVLDYAPPTFETAAIPAGSSEEEQIAATEDADFLLLFGAGVSRRVLEASPRLKHIQLLSAGYDRIDFAVTDALGIPVSNNGGANSWAVAEATIGLILCVLRRLVEADAFLRAGCWRGSIGGFDTYELAGKTVGIVGLGNIGKKVARRLRPFEVDLLYTDTVADPALEQELGMKRLSLTELLPAVEILTLHVPALPSTRHLIGAAELARMKTSAILINTCRGTVVDERALIAALQEGRLRGAGLDVFEQEPLPPDSPLCRMSNVVLSGHLAGTTYDTLFRRAQFAFENLAGIWQGAAPMAVVHGE